jgi:hypothetical protein
MNDRDLGIIGAGAFLTVLCLLFKWPFVLRIVVGLLVLVGFMLIALVRAGPDREPLEVHLARWWHNLRSPRKYSYHSGDQEGGNGAATPRRAGSFMAAFHAPEAVQTQAEPAVPLPPEGRPNVRPNFMPPVMPIALAWEEVGVYRLVTVLLAIVGAYFIYWLFQGGTDELGLWLRSMLRITH